MTRLSAALAILCLSVSGASPALATAADPRVEAAFGNTIVLTYPSGKTGHLWLKPDGTYGYEGRRKTPSSGRWTIRGERICLKQSKPRAIPFSHCTAIKAGGVGTTWPGKAPGNETVEFKLVEGIVR